MNEASEKRNGWKKEGGEEQALNELKSRSDEHERWCRGAVRSMDQMDLTIPGVRKPEVC